MIASQIAVAAGALLAAALVGGWWVLRRRARAVGRGGVRPLLALLVRRRVLRGRAAFARLFPGAYVHFPAEDVDRGATLPGEALALRDARGGALVRFSLADLYEVDQPTADVLPRVLEIPDDALRPERIVFTLAPHRLRQAAERAFEAGHLAVEAPLVPFTPSAEDPFGTLVVRTEASRYEVPLGDLVAEAVTTVTPLAQVVRDRALRLEAESAVDAAFVAVAGDVFGAESVSVEDDLLVVRRPGRPPRRLDHHRLPRRIAGGRGGWAAYLTRLRDEGEAAPEEADGSGGWVGRRLAPLSVRDGAGDRLARDRGGFVELYTWNTGWDSVPLQADHPAAQGRSLDEVGRLADAGLHRAAFSGYVIVTRGSPEAPESLTVVGPRVASIAQSPALLLGAAEEAGVFGPGQRVRVRCEREGALVVAEGRAREPFLAACRRAAARLADALDLALGGPVHLDLTLTLGERPLGRFAFQPVSGAFFSAEKREREARGRGALGRAAEARAMMRLALGDLEGARAHLAEAVRVRPDDPDLHLALGTLLNDLGEHARAEAVLRRAVRLSPDSPANNNNLGVAYQGLGRQDEAAFFFEKAAALEPGDPLVRVNLGRVRLEAGDLTGAEASFQEALARDRACVPALTGLVVAAVHRGDAEDARRRLAQALAVDPADEALLRLHRALHPDELMH